MPARLATRFVSLGPRAERNDYEGVADAVLRTVVRNLGYRGHRRQRSLVVVAVHRVGTRCEGFALLAAVRRGAGLLAVDHVRGDGHHRHGGQLMSSFSPNSTHLGSKQDPQGGVVDGADLAGE